MSLWKSPPKHDRKEIVQNIDFLHEYIQYVVFPRQQHSLASVRKKRENYLNLFAIFSVL